MTMFKTNQTGTALLLALIVMSALVAGGVAIGTVIVNEIRQARQLDQAIIAHYGAESGAERLLFFWRETRDNNLFTQGCPLSAVDNDKSQVGWNCSLNPGTLQQLSFNLSQYQVEEFPLYNPNDLSVGKDFQSAVISWSDADASNLYDPWLEVTLLEWPRSPSVNFASSKNIIKRVFKCSPTSGATCDIITMNDFSPSNSYIVRLRALKDDVENVTIKFFSSDNGVGNPIDFSDYIRVADFTGDYRGVKQGVRVRFPVVEPSSSMFDFVLFSEESLLKSLF